MNEISLKEGRPTKYKLEYIQQTEEYIQHCRDSSMVPWIEELALDIGVDDDTLVEWAKIYPEFSASIKRLKSLQQLRLQQLGMTNPTMPIFLLKANHGFMETEKRIVDGNYNIDIDGLIGLSKTPTQAAISDSDPTEPKV